MVGGHEAADKTDIRIVPAGGFSQQATTPKRVSTVDCGAPITPLDLKLCQISHHNNACKLQARIEKLINTTNFILYYNKIWYHTTSV